MSGVNKVILVGRMGDDPAVRAFDNGDQVANVSLATSETWTDKQGKKQESTEWHKVAFFGRLAEIVEEYTRKGSQIYVEGKLKTRKYEDKDGIDRYITEVVALSLQLLDAKPKEESRGRDRDEPKERSRDEPKGRSRDNEPRDRDRVERGNDRARSNARRPVDDDLDDEIPF